MSPARRRAMVAPWNGRYLSCATNRSDDLMKLKGLLNVSLFALAFGACAPAMAPPAALEPGPIVEPFPHEAVWSSRVDLPLIFHDGSAIPLPHLFTPLAVIRRDSVGLQVRCERCGDGWEGWVDEGGVVFDEGLPPEVAAWSSLAHFAISIREAAIRRDLEALRPVMASDFSFSLIGIQSPESALAVWRGEQFATLDRLPALLDEGIATRDHRFWSAPPAFVEQIGYRGLRAGFRQRVDGRWEWLYLIAGILEG
jgi:hypothetical protein